MKNNSFKNVERYLSDLRSLGNSSLNVRELKDEMNDFEFCCCCLLEYALMEYKNDKPGILVTHFGIVNSQKDIATQFNCFEPSNILNRYLCDNFDGVHKLQFLVDPDYLESFDESDASKNGITNDYNYTCNKAINCDDFSVFCPIVLRSEFNERLIKLKEARKSDSVKEGVKDAITNNEIRNGRTKSYYCSLSTGLNDAQRLHNSADREFYDMFRKDETGNLYLAVGNNEYKLIELTSNSKQISCDSDFWTSFVKLYSKKFFSIIEKIENDCRLFELENGEDTNLVDSIRIYTPKIICNLLNVRIIEADEDKTFKVMFKLGDSTDAKGAIINEDSMRKYMCEIVRSFDVSEIKMLRNFAINRTGEQKKANALNTIEVSFDINAYHDKMYDPFTKLPDFAKTFFTAKLVHNKYSQFYRFSKFIKGVIDPQHFDRKAIILAGKGRDGKSLFINAMKEYLDKVSNKRQYIDILSKNFNDDTSKGLSGALGKRILIVSETEDIEALVNSSTFKMITGGDTLSVNVKYAVPVQYNWKGCTVIITTNRHSHLSSEATISRISPIQFAERQDGEQDWDTEDVNNKLVSEMSDIFKVCCEYANTVDNLICGQIKHSETPIFDDEQLTSFLSQEKIDTHYSIETRNNRMLTFNKISPSSMFSISLKGTDMDEYTDLNNDIMEWTFNELFEEDENSYLKASEFTEQILKEIRNYEGKVITKLKDCGFTLDKKFLNEFKKWLASRETNPIYYKTNRINGKSVSCYKGIKRKGEKSVKVVEEPSSSIQFEDREEKLPF